MKTIVIYYSYSGITKACAEKEAAQRGADIVQAEDVKRPGMLKTFFVGCPAATRHKSWPIQKPDVKLDDYETIVVMGPVWASNFAPQVNAIIALLPAGRDVELIATSGSGSAKLEKTVRQVEDRGCSVAATRHVKN